MYLCWPMKSCRRFRRLVLYEAQSPSSPKSRELAQHGGPPGWLEESDPAGVILYLMDGPYTGCLFCNVQVALTKASQLRADVMSSCCYLLNVHNHLS